MTDNKTEEKPDNEVSIIQLQFADVRQPSYKENKQKGFISYGENNDYPDYLLELFDTSGKHGAIVSGKAGYIVGNGFSFVDETVAEKYKNVLEKANNKGESLDEIGGKLALDMEIFGGGYLEILFSRVGKVAEIYHLDFTKVRPNKDLTKFYFSEEWNKEQLTKDGIKLVENRQVEPEEIPAFDPAKPKGKQVLYVREYRPKMKVYPKPNYFAALRYIQIDVCIGEYHLNGITNGMFASKLVNFNNGVPSDEDKKTIEKKVNNKFAGAKNAGKIMLSFNKSGEHAPTVLDLSGTELDKHFDLLDKTVEKQIFSSHRVTTPSLFGIKTDSLFGNRTELRDGFELFQNTYINEKRTLIEKHFNAVLSINKVPKIYLQRSEPLGITFSEQTIAGVLTEDEIRETLGKKPKTPEQKAEAAAAAPTAGAASPGRFQSDLNDTRDASIFAEFGKKKSDYRIIESKKIINDNDFEFADDSSIKGNKKLIIDLIDADPLIDAAAIAAALDITIDAAEGLLTSMESEGLIESKDGQRKSTPEAKKAIDNSETTSIKVMYSYEGIQDDRNRPFCAKMLELDKLYSREDIEAISTRLGYSVWDRRGGWYRPKGATEASPSCRHHWQTNTVISKN